MRRVIQIIFSIIIFAAAIIATVFIVKYFNEFRYKALIVIATIWLDLMAILIFIAGLIGVDIESYEEEEHYADKEG